MLDADALLSVDDLHVSFPARGMRRWSQRVRAVDGVSFDIGRGESLGLVGESGSGKSTTARAVMRLAAVDAGTITLDGVRLDSLTGADLRRRRKALQMVFQDPYSSLDPTMTVGEAIEQPLRVHTDLDRVARRAAAAELLERVQLGADFADRYPDELSGGQRQRVAIARAVALGPQLVVCDEAVSALDVSTQNQIVNLLEELQDSLGTSYLFIAHDLAVVRHIAHRVAVMYLGQLVEVGPTERVFATPQHPYTAALLGAIPVPLPRVQRTRPRMRLVGDVPDPSKRPSGCVFHPRCPHAFDRCRVERPQPHALAAGGWSACHLLDLPDRPELPGAWDPQLDAELPPVGRPQPAEARP